MPGMDATGRARAALIALLPLLIACSAATPTTAPAATATAPATAHPTTPGAGMLASVERRGGLCPDGACDRTVTLDRDGRIRVSGQPPEDLGVVPEAHLRALGAAIAATDFAALRRPAFSGVCPTAYDGQELVFTFATEHGAERLASCETALDLTAPLFRALDAALGEASPIGVGQ